MRRVYPETTIFSYLGARESSHPASIFRQKITKRWWESRRDQFELCVSAAVEEECARGDSGAAKLRLDLLRGVRRLSLNDAIIELAQVLVAPGGFPASAAVDALHVAVATVHQCDYLLTWNIRHIANAEIRRTTERIIRENGYQTSTICTSEELFGLETLE